MGPGDLVEMPWEGGRRLVAVVVGEEKRKLRLMSEEGGELLLPEGRQWRSLGSVHPVPGEPQRAAAVAQRAAEEIRRFEQELDLDALWELLVDGGERYLVEELTDLAFAQDNPLARAALWRAVEANGILFRVKRDQLEPATRKSVEETLHQRAVAEERARAKAEAQDALQRALSSGEPLGEGEHEELLDLLVGLAIHGTEYQKAGQASELLTTLTGVPGGREPHLKAFELLVRLGRFHHDENLYLLRAQVPLSFRQALLNEAEQLSQQRPWEDSVRTDLTHLLAVAVDDPETTEVDDALSAERVGGGGWNVWVHIADPGAWIEPGSELLREASRRAATLYLPERKVTMLPPVLAEGPVSLVADEDRAALTLQARVSPEGEIEEARFLISKVRVDKRLTYEEADQLLQERGAVGDLLHHLQEAAFALESRRRAHGAFVLNGPEVKVRVYDGQVDVQPIDRFSPSRASVAEMMILVGTAAADLFRREGLPAIYRVQEAPDVPLELPDGPLDPAMFYQMVRKLRRAELSRIPGRHAGLGVEPYVQMSSPIRRFSDLLLQQQMKCFLQRGEPCYDEEDLFDALGSAELTAATLSVVERESKRFWTIRYLEGLKGSRRQAVVLEERQAGHYLVELVDLCLKVTLEGPAGMDPGTVVEVRIGNADARRDKVSLRFVERSREVSDVL